MMRYTRKVLQQPMSLSKKERAEYWFYQLEEQWQKYAVWRTPTRLILKTLRRALTVYYMSDDELKPRAEALLKRMERTMKEVIISRAKRNGFESIALSCPWRTIGMCELTDRPCIERRCPLFSSQSIVQYAVEDDGDES